MSVKLGLTGGGTLQTRTMLAPFDHEEVKVVHGEDKDQSAGRLVVPKFPDGAREEQQGHSSSGKNPRQADGQGGSRRSEEPTQQDPDQAEKEDDKASTGGMSSLGFNFLSDFENGMDALEATTEPPDAGTSVGLHGKEPELAGEQLSEQFQKYRTETLDGITKEKKNRRLCQSTFLGSVSRRRVGGAS